MRSDRCFSVGTIGGTTLMQLISRWRAAASSLCTLHTRCLLTGFQCSSGKGPDANVPPTHRACRAVAGAGRAVARAGRVEGALRVEGAERRKARALPRRHARLRSNAHSVLKISQSEQHQSQSNTSQWARCRQQRRHRRWLPGRRQHNVEREAGRKRTQINIVSGSRHAASAIIEAKVCSAPWA